MVSQNPHQRPQRRPALPKQFVDEYKRERCATALCEAVRERGWQKTTVGDVCKKAGVGRATFYELFDGLAGAATYTAEWARRPLLDPLEAAAGEDGSWETRLEVGLKAFAEQLEERPEAAEFCLVHAASFAERPDGPYDREVVRALATLFSEALPSATLAEMWAYGVLSLVARQLVSGIWEGLPTELRPPHVGFPFR